MRCAEGFHAEGEVRLMSAHVGGSLVMEGATLRSSPPKPAMSADGLTVERDVYCTYGFQAVGELSLVGARVGGTLSFDGARLVHPASIALQGDRLRVEQDLNLGSPGWARILADNPSFDWPIFVAEGQLRLVRAQVGG